MKFEKKLDIGSKANCNSRIFSLEKLDIDSKNKTVLNPPQPVPSPDKESDHNLITLLKDEEH
jgi:hypothetical protein